jgi:hypothetical protein
LPAPMNPMRTSNGAEGSLGIGGIVAGDKWKTSSIPDVSQRGRGVLGIAATVSAEPV